MKAATEKERVFIVGCRRSGTTWTMMLLAQHPDVVALQQIDFFRRLSQLGSWFQSDGEYGMRVLRPGDGDDGLERLTVRAALEGRAFAETVRPLATEIYERLAAAHPGAKAIVEQTPEYVQVWEDVLAVFPEARFLHVVRDPRSVFASHRNAARSWADPTRFSYDPLEVAAEWKREVTRGRAIAGATDRYLEVSYEAMKKEPEAHLGRILEWIGLSADEALVARSVEACRIDRMRGSSHAPQGFFRRGEAAGWKNELSAAEVRAVEHVAGDLMRELGHELVNQGRIAPPLRLRARRARAAVRAKVASWAWNEDSPLRNGASRLLKAFPGVRRALLKSIKKPASP